MGVAVEHARKHARRDGARLRLRLLERDEPLRAQPFERFGRKRRIHQHVGEDAERVGEARGRADEADGAALRTDADRHVRAEQLQGVREIVAAPRLRSLAHHRGGQPRDASAIGRLELVRAAKERDRKRHERQVVLLGHDELGAVGELRFGPGGHAQLGRLAERRLFGAIEGLREAEVSAEALRHRSRTEAGHCVRRTRNDGTRAVRTVRRVIGPSCFLPASRPGRSARAARRSTRCGRWSDTCSPRAARRPVSPRGSSDIQCGSSRRRRGSRHR